MEPACLVNLDDAQLCIKNDDRVSDSVKKLLEKFVWFSCTLVPSGNLHAGQQFATAMPQSFIGEDFVSVTLLI